MKKKIVGKTLVMGLVVSLVGIAFFPSLNAINLQTTDDKNPTEITSRIIFSDGMKSIKTKLSDTQTFKVNRILEDMSNKLENIKSQEECNIIFEETLIELSNYGLLGRNSVKDVINIMINGDSNYSINGKSTHTNFLGSTGIKFYELSLEHDGNWGLLFYDLYHLFFHIYNIIRCRSYSNGWITFGYAVCKWDGSIYKWIPSIGNITIVNSEGEEQYNGEFYGQIFTLWIDQAFNPVHSVRDYCVGVKGFKGINIGNSYFGTAEEVNIDINPPD
jgi:hypothetical protein